MASLGAVGAVGVAPRAPALRAPRRARARVTAPARVVATQRVALSPSRRHARDVRCAGFFDNLFGKKSDDDAKEGGASAADGTRDEEDDAASVSSGATGTDSTKTEAFTEKAFTDTDSAAPPIKKEPLPEIKKTDFATTMSALDALLPVDEAAEKRAAEEAADEARAERLMRERGERVTKSVDENEGVTVTVSPEALRALGGKKKNDESSDEADDENDESALPSDLIKRNLEKRERAKRREREDGDKERRLDVIAEGDEDRWLDTVVGGLSESAKRDRGDRTDAENARLDKVLDELNALASLDTADRDSDEIRDKFDSLFEILEINSEPAVSKADVQKLKDEVFGYGTFWVTGVEELGPEIAGEGVLIKGNLRADRLEVWRLVREKVETLFDGKYTPFMLEEPGFEGEESGGGAGMSGTFDSGDGGAGGVAKTRGPRVSFLIVPSDKAGPNPRTSAWQYVVAFVLFGLTTGSAVQLGLVAEISRLPAETAAWLAQGAAGVDTSLAPGELPPGLEGFDAAAYVEGAFPVFAGIFASAMAHEVGHTVAALARDVKISIPFLIPNGQLGTFGSITQIKSLPKTREDLFDVAIAGPIAGGTVAGTLFFYGLALSLNGDPNTLLPVPNELFNGSLLLGSVAQLFLGDAAQTAKGAALVHPLFVAGWYVFSVSFPKGFSSSTF
jgi:Zn-dependent protease